MEGVVENDNKGGALAFASPRNPSVTKDKVIKKNVAQLEKVSEK